MNRRNTVILAFCGAVLPTAAWANAGTPLMWVGMLHLVFGNAFVGVLEGFLLAAFFGLRKGRSIGLLILANYFSAWVGGLFLSGSIAHALPLDLNNAWFLFWVMVVITYLFTLVLEFPFVSLAFRGDPRWLSKSVRGSLIIQTISYVLLFGWYWMASGTSLYTKTDVVPPAALSLPKDVLMYYISAEDGNVYATGLSSLDKRKVFDLHSSNRNDRLYVRVSSVNSNRWDLLARLEDEDRRDPKLVTVRESFAAEAAPSWGSMEKDARPEEGSWFNFGPAARLGGAQHSGWEFRSGFWPIEGLQGKQTNTGNRAGFSFETPFGAWIVRNATLLPGDKVLFQLGENQICAFDPLSQRIALVTKGRGPIAVIREDKSDAVLKKAAPNTPAQSTK
ncbi:MAG: hypothetical protein NTY53_26175 [Kiritimatiellaeota bacterium]|nr:hypothetical protein [Kiritimatiellota bacterium]